MFIIQDGLQFIVQNLNTLLIGNELSMVQVLSPMISLVGVSTRLMNYLLSVHRKAFLVHFCTFGMCVLPVFLIIGFVFNFHDKRPLWGVEISNSPELPF